VPHGKSSINYGTLTTKVFCIVVKVRHSKNVHGIETSTRLKLIDSYMVFLMATGIIQFIYCLLVGTFPYNAFLSGFISTVGAFVFAGKIQRVV
jgi:hypothetical protein